MQRRSWGILAVVILAALPILGCRKAPAAGAAAIGKPWVASAARPIYHRPTCEWAGKIPTANLRGYDTPAEAQADGKRPCRVCQPDQ